ncbi:hypothetical protein ACFY1P_20750 [Streptomyces sp. NPDC001407]|uniref:hypothetical protein n=1 Tax=Streptomyces sp. NPDC001407 TaxID=3364573 RepID=UPI0036BF8D31
MHKSRSRKRVAEDGVSYRVAERIETAARDSRSAASRHGSVVGLVTTGSLDEARGLAENLAAAWVLEGERVLVLEQARPLSGFFLYRQRSQRRPVPKLATEWSERYAHPGGGLLAALAVRDDEGLGPLRDEGPVQTAIAAHRADFDRIVLIQDIRWHRSSAVQAYVPVVEQCWIPQGYEQTVHQGTSASTLAYRYSPAQAAALLRERLTLELSRKANLAELPLLGLLHHEVGSSEQQQPPPGFTKAVLEEMAAGGTPVLATVPHLLPRIEKNQVCYPLPVIDAPSSPEAVALKVAAQAVRTALGRSARHDAPANARSMGSGASAERASAAR